MLEAIAVPVVKKAIDFLFEEVSKIIKNKKTKHSESDDAIPLLEGTEKTDLGNAIVTKEQAISHKLSDANVKKNLYKIEHLMKLINIHTKNYYLAKEKYALWGRELVPAIVVHSLEDSEKEIIQTAQELQVVLSEVYEQKVVNPALMRIVK